MMPTPNVAPISDANRLGLLYRHERHRLPYTGPIWDVHLHLNDIAAARLFFQVADLFGIERVWTMTPLRTVPDLLSEFGDRVELIAVPDYSRRHEARTFAHGFLQDIETFASYGCRICKFWAAPRGRDVHPALRLDHPVRHEAMKLARRLGMIFMSHVADPDTWFASHYRDHYRYGKKLEHYQPLMRLLDEFADVPWIGAHMGGFPEDLDFLERMLDRYPNYVLDTSATKWMVRELSKRPDELRDFVRRNPGRVLWGTDIVASDHNMDFDLYASRFWAMRALWETAYDGPSPIVDPDLSMLDPTLPRESTARLRGINLDAATLQMVYHGAASTLLPARNSG